MQTEQIKIASDAEEIGSRYIIAYNALMAFLSETSSAVGGAKAIARLLDMGDPDAQASHADDGLERALTALDALRLELDRILGSDPALAPTRKVFSYDPELATTQRVPVRRFEDGGDRLGGTTDNQ